MVAGQRVLIVDDEPDILHALSDYLQATLPGLSVCPAADGRAALAAFEEQPADLVVSDFRMPIMDGLEFLGKVHERWPGTPAILLTAFPDMDLAIRALNDGRVRKFLTKPVDPKHLHDLVRDLLAESRAAKQRLKALRRATGTHGSSDV